MGEMVPVPSSLLNEIVVESSTFVFHLGLHYTFFAEKVIMHRNRVFLHNVEFCPQVFKVQPSRAVNSSSDPSINLR